MVEQLADELSAELPVDGHPGGPGYLEWETARYQLLVKYLKRAYEAGLERGKEIEGNYWNS